MNSLASRKQLLITESELNRAQLVQEWQMMSGEVHSLTNRVKIVGSLGAIASLLVAGLAFSGRKPSVPVAEKYSWWGTIMKGAQLAGSLWSQFRSPDRKMSDK